MANLNLAQIDEEGVGIEMEGYIMDENGTPTPRIDGKASPQWITSKIGNSLRPHIDCEQTSVTLEIKTRVYPTPEEAVPHVYQLREDINRILAEKGLRLVFVPITDKQFEIIPAAGEGDEYHMGQFKDWKAIGGRRILESASICGMQINDSRAFAGTTNDAQRLEIARLAHNHFTRDYNALCSVNDPSITDRLGQTRLETIEQGIMIPLKGPAFKKAGYRWQEIVRPPIFHTREEMIRWMCAHSSVERLEDTVPKKEHSFTIKVKRPKDSPWVLETRMHDAVDTEEAALRVVEVTNPTLIKCLTARDQVLQDLAAVA